MGKKLKVDFSDTDEEIRRRSKSSRVPEGEYKVKINNVTIEKTKDQSGRYLRWECIIAEGKQKGKRLFGNTSLKKEALWSLRNLIHAATGKNVAGKVASFDPESLIGKIVGAAVSDNVYEDKDGNEKVSSQIDSFFPKKEVASADDDDEDDEEDEDDEDEEEEDDDEEEEEEEKPKKKKKKATKKKKDEDDDEDEDEDLDEVDLDEL